MLPFYKVFSLVIRVFSRPLINHTKKYHATNKAGKSQYIRQIFIKLGNFYHRMESHINRKFLKIESSFAYKPLNEELAVQKGIEFFYECMFYGIIISLPLYELYVASSDAKRKSELLERRLSSLEQTTISLHEDLVNINNHLQEERREKVQKQKAKKERAQMEKVQKERVESQKAQREMKAKEVEQTQKVNQAQQVDIPNEVNKGQQWKYFVVELGHYQKTYRMVYL